MVEKPKENFGRKPKRKFLVEKLKEITDTPPPLPCFFQNFGEGGGICSVTPWFMKTKGGRSPTGKKSKIWPDKNLMSVWLQFLFFFNLSKKYKSYELSKLLNLHFMKNVVAPSPKCFACDRVKSLGGGDSANTRDEMVVLGRKIRFFNSPA